MTAGPWGGGAELGAEDRLLLLCARIEPDAGQRQELVRVAGGLLDWERVVRLAARQGISGLLARHLVGTAAGSGMPQATRRALEAAWQAARLIGLRQRAECGRLLEALSRADVEAMALKGLALRETVYPDPGLRLSGDLDLLVRQGALGRAEAALRGLGYVAGSLPPGRGHDPGPPFHLPPYRLPGRDFQVELHWDLMPPGGGVRVDLDGMWQRSVAQPIAGQGARLPSAEDMLLHLALHAAALNRMQIGLRHVVDVAETARYYQGQLDWDALARRAGEWGAERFVYLTLRVADGLVGVTGAGPALESLRPAGWDESLAEAACRRVLSLAPPQAEGQMVESAAHFLRAPSAREKLLWVKQNLFLPSEVMAGLYRLPPKSRRLWVYYMVRPARMLWRYAGLLLGAARGREESTAAVAAVRAQRALDRWLGRDDGR